MESSLDIKENINLDLIFKKLEALNSFEETQVDTLVSESSIDELEFLKKVFVCEKDYESTIARSQEAIKELTLSQGRIAYEKLYLDSKRLSKNIQL